MRPAQALGMRLTRQMRWGWYNAPNNVPHLQRIAQRATNERPYYKMPRSKYMLYPYFTLTYITLACCIWMLIRMAFGKRSWFGPK